MVEVPQKIAPLAAAELLWHRSQSGEATYDVETKPLPTDGTPSGSEPIKDGQFARPR